MKVAMVIPKPKLLSVSSNVPFPENRRLDKWATPAARIQQPNMLGARINLL
jgi:hypothetical protein